jgi:hypothetical protein
MTEQQKNLDNVFFVIYNTVRTVKIGLSVQNRTEQNRTEQNRTEERHIPLGLGGYTKPSFLSTPQGLIGALERPVL